MTTLKVIGAGFGRTGTSSLKTALEQLGFGPCHHMEEVFRHPEQIPLWVAVARGEAVDWDAVFRGYESAVDFPTSYWYREIMAHWPDARVILTVRDPDGWYRSTRATIYAINRDIPNRWVARFFPVVGRMFEVTDLIWRDLFGGRFLEREHALAVYERHIEEVKAHVPADKLLVFDVKQGWAPLCEFLGVPVPSDAFPHRNDTEEFRRRVRMTKAVGWVMLALPVLLLALVLWLVLSESGFASGLG
jgi:hypothetical protein